MSSIVNRVSGYDILALAGIKPPQRPNELIRSPLGTHEDKTPSFHAFREGFYCHGCGGKGGILDLAVALGLAHDRRHAAHVLEQYEGGCGFHRLSTNNEEAQKGR